MHPRTHRTHRALASVTLGLALMASATPLTASESATAGLAAPTDFAGAKAKAAAAGKLVLIDFSSPT